MDASGMQQAGTGSAARRICAQVARADIDPQEAELMAGRIWTPEVLSSESTFSATNLAVAEAVYECYAYNRWHTAVYFYNCLRAARGIVSTDPFLVKLEHHIAIAGATLANWSNAEVRPDEALEIIETNWRMLDAKDARLATHGRPPQPTALARAYLLNILAGIKSLRGHDRYKNVVLEPRQQNETWLSLIGLAEKRSMELNEPPNRVRDRMRMMLGAGLNVAVCARRYAREALPQIVERFNAIYQQHYGGAGACGLAYPLGHWKRHPEHLSPHPWYWRYEIAKLWLNVQAKPLETAQWHRAVLADLEQLYQRLIKAERNFAEAEYNAVHLAALMRDRDEMRAELHRRIGPD